MNLNLPFKIAYAGPVFQGQCESCFLKFNPDELQIAEMVQSQVYDRKDPMWHHVHCFFQTHEVKHTNHIEYFENIKYEDQLEVIAKIDPESAEKFKKIAKKRAFEESELGYKNFGIEYANSNSEICTTCQEPIDRSELCIKKNVFDTNKTAQFGKEVLRAHIHCFIFNRDQYDYLWDGKLLAGFNELQPAHQMIIKEALPAIIQVEVNAKKPRRAFNEEDLEMKIASQTEELVRIRKSLQSVCSKEDLQILLIINECNVVEGIENMQTLLDRCADIITFGSLYKCQKCQKGDMMFSKYGYTCNAWIDEWIKCGNTEESPLRMKCLIPNNLKQNAFFATFEPKAVNRAVRLNTARDEPMPSTSAETSTIRKVRFEKLQLKDGAAVDPKSRLEKIAHVYRSNKDLYNSVLVFTDIQNNKNSFYKLQVLESDKNINQLLMGAVQNVHNYWLFTTWGRTGTNIGGSKVSVMGSADSAIAQFEKLYEKQTGNKWKLRENSKKLPGKFYPIDINFSDKIETNTSVPSKLAPQVEKLMKMIFDVNKMEMTMEEFKLDVQKMPLGKLSVKQLQAAYVALNEIQNVIDAGSSSNELVGLSNKFFTLIPHNFGLEKAPILDTLKKINKKMDLVDSLLDIQNAFAIMNEAPITKMNSYDAYYKQLNAEIACLDRNSTDFKLIETYIKNTSMGGQKLTIEAAFTIQRHGEKDRFANYKNLHNRQLLWHGSPATNFASIIKNGLKNPQGRGIYFADMISKSIAYCRLAPPQTGLLTLSEVALGNMNQGQSLLGYGRGTKAGNQNYHSTKMTGNPQPDMSKAHVREDGVIIPLGRPLNFNMNQPSMHGESEFIIQNEAQVHMQYLVMVKFSQVKATSRNVYPF